MHHQSGALTKHDLQFQYPTGPTANDDPTKRGEPDSSLLNRHEWYEVLYFVNKFANLCGKGSADIARKAERLIHRVVPGDLRSHQHIQDWLIKHWGQYPTI